MLPSSIDNRRRRCTAAWICNDGRYKFEPEQGGWISPENLQFLAAAAAAATALKNNSQSGSELVSLFKGRAEVSPSPGHQRAERITTTYTATLDSS